MIIGVIGGSGLYDWNVAQSSQLLVETPFGGPSGPITRLSIGPNEILFLPRHGQGHVFSPSEVNYRANVYALKQLGAQTLLSVSAVGSLQPQIPPGMFAFPDQYIDMTKGVRPNTFFGSGIVGHLDFADPTCASLRAFIIQIAKQLGLAVHEGGVYVCIEGPQFSTRAESHLYRTWGASLIGMTAMPEARLAREAGLAYQTVALVTDYDCWNNEKEAVSAQAVLEVLEKNVANARKLVMGFAESSLPDFGSEYRGNTRRALVTAVEKWPLKAREIIETLTS